MSATDQAPIMMTVAEFLSWSAPNGGDRWELVDGTPRPMPPLSPRHALIQAEILRLIGNHVTASRRTCRVLSEPGIQPKVRGKINLRVPHLAVTCASIDPDDRLLREPLVVLGILSPSR